MRSDVVFVLTYKGYTAGPFAGEADCVVEVDADGPAIKHWTHSDPEPDAAKIDEWAAESGYATWRAEHGGDLAATLRRQAVEALEAQQQHLVAIDRAVLVELLLYTNAKLTIIASYLKTKHPTDAAAHNAFVANLATAEQGIGAVKNRLRAG